MNQLRAELDVERAENVGHKSIAKAHVLHLLIDLRVEVAKPDRRVNQDEQQRQAKSERQSGDRRKHLDEVVGADDDSHQNDVRMLSAELNDGSEARHARETSVPARSLRFW